MPKMLRSITLLAAAGLLDACATVGYQFPVDRVAQLQIGVTTQSEVKRLFGEPWRVGWENGERTWTYGHYRYSLFSPAETRDLLLRFDRQGILQSYSYNTTETAGD